MRGKRVWSETEIVKHAIDFIEMNQKEWYPLRMYADVHGIAKSTLQRYFTMVLPKLDEELGIKYAMLAKEMSRIGVLKGGYTGYGCVANVKVENDATGVCRTVYIVRKGNVNGNAGS